MTVRFVGKFLDDPPQVPSELLDYLAEQLEIEDSSCVKSYGDREKTPFEHVWEIRAADDWQEYSARTDELGEWIEGRAWTTGDGPKAWLPPGPGRHRLGGRGLATAGVSSSKAVTPVRDGAICLAKCTMVVAVKNVNA
jgi:hypothetical protein